MKLGKIYLQFHPIAVHFTNALFPVALFFLILYLFFRLDSYKDTYFYILALATISSPIAYVTWIVDWKKRYKGAKTSTFVRKIRSGIVLIIVGIICTAWYGTYPDVLDGTGAGNIVFLGLNLSTLPLTVALGHLGGKLVFMVQR
jgi:uncharacterized membrane protein